MRLPEYQQVSWSLTVSPSGTVTFRYDYRLHGRRETLTLGRYGPGGISLAMARELLLEARKTVLQGVSPALEKQRTSAQRPSAELAQAVGLDMAAWWQPAAEGYFQHVSKAAILQAAGEYAPEHVTRLAKLKKADMASEAERLAAGTARVTCAATVRPRAVWRAPTSPTFIPSRAAPDCYALR